MRTDDRHNPDWLLIGITVWAWLGIIGLISLVYWATRLLEALL
jgi:hypothetical protein